MSTSNNVRRIAMFGFGAVLAISLWAGFDNTAQAKGNSGGNHGHSGFSHDGYRNFGNHWNYGYGSSWYGYSYPSYGYEYSYPSYSYDSSYSYSPSYYGSYFGYGHNGRSFRGHDRRR
jgi:hypothetical protein